MSQDQRSAHFCFQKMQSGIERFSCTRVKGENLLILSFGPELTFLITISKSSSFQNLYPVSYQKYVNWRKIQKYSGRQTTSDQDVIDSFERLSINNSEDYFNTNFLIFLKISKVNRCEPNKNHPARTKSVHSVHRDADMMRVISHSRLRSRCTFLVRVG